MRDKKCNLEVMNDGIKECRAICLKYLDKRCCKRCNGLNNCNKICGFIRDLRKK